MVSNVDKLLTILQSLYAKRADLDKTIIKVEKTLALAAGEVDKLKKTTTAKASSVKKAVKGISGLTK
jgi:hypothetical protein